MSTSFDAYIYNRTRSQINPYEIRNIVYNTINEYMSQQNFVQFIENIVNNYTSTFDYITVNSDYTPSVDNDYTILVDASSGPVTITLPDPSTKPGKVFFIKKIDSTSNPITISSSHGIDTYTNIPFDTQNQILAVQSISTKWVIIWR